jgi:hypothetical protein
MLQDYEIAVKFPKLAYEITINNNLTNDVILPK